MSRELLERAKSVIQAATKRGAAGVRATISRRRSSSVEWRDGKVDRLRESTQMTLALTLYVQGRYSVNATSDLRPAAVDRFLDETIASTKVLAKDPHRKLADPERYKGMHQGDLGVFDPDPAPTAVDRRQVARALEEAARSGQDAKQIVSVTSSCSDSLGEAVMVTSNGMEGTHRGTSFSMFAETSVRDQGGRKPEGYSYASRRFRKALPAVESIGAEASRRALRAIGAKPEKSGEYACVIENRIVERLLDGLVGQPLTGRAIQQRRSFLADMVGKTVASPVLTVTDDPFVPGGLDSRVYDDEGMARKKIDVIERGVLKVHYLDTYYASKLARAPTTDSWSNLVFVPGSNDLEGLLKTMGSGILVTDFSGGNSNSATGDFSIGISGLWVENGKVTRPVTEMNLAGNHLTFWKRLAQVGSDAFLDSSARTPSFRFDKVQFSGV